MLVYLPDPVTCCVKAAEGGKVEFTFHDPLHADAFGALMERAVRGGYAVQLRLIHYEGKPDATEQREARQAKKKAAQDGLLLETSE